MFAEKTKVPVEKTRMEIDRLLTKHGAKDMMIGARAGDAFVVFKMQGRLLRFSVRMPDPDRNVVEVRRRWRALLLVLKAKLEAALSGITTFEREFLSHVVMPGGQTVGELIAPQIAAAYESNTDSPLQLAYDDSSTTT